VGVFSCAHACVAALVSVYLRVPLEGALMYWCGCSYNISRLNDMHILVATHYVHLHPLCLCLW
jgi:hypothetical protein